MRLAMISMPLTDEQRAQIGERTGTNPTEALVVGVVSTDEPIENELTSDADREFAQVLWDSNQQFVEAMDQSGAVLDAYVEHMGHKLHPDAPNIVWFR